MLSQLRSGAIEFFTLSGLILSTLVPVASINGVGFAFKDYDQVWTAMDGELGALCARRRSPRPACYAFEKMWDNGFRQITSSTQADQDAGRPEGPQDPRAGEPALDLDVQGVRRGADVSINFTEVYSALQTKVVEGQENPLADHRDRQALRGAEVSAR